MKNKISLALGLLLSISVYGAKKVSKQKTFTDRGTLGTSFRFDGTSLHGKFQSSPSTTVSVESDKYLEDLLGARKSFDDRIAKERSRN